MPKAAVDEDRDLQPWEGDVGYPARLFQHLEIDAIAQSGPVQFATQSQLRIGSLLPDLRHALAGFG